MIKKCILNTEYIKMLSKIIGVPVRLFGSVEYTVGVQVIFSPNIYFKSVERFLPDHQTNQIFLYLTCNELLKGELQKNYVCFFHYQINSQGMECLTEPFICYFAVISDLSKYLHQDNNAQAVYTTLQMNLPNYELFWEHWRATSFSNFQPITLERCLWLYCSF